MYVTWERFAQHVEVKPILRTQNKSPGCDMDHMYKYNRKDILISSSVMIGGVIVLG